MISFLKLIRYKNLIMVLLTMVLTKYALIDSFVNQSILSNFKFALLLFSVLLITAGGYIINDIFDIEADKINKQNKIFIGKIISKKNAQRVYYTLTFLGLIIGIYLSIVNLNPTIFLLFPICVILLYAYSRIFKKQILIGNFIVSSLTIFPILMIESLSYSSFGDFNFITFLNSKQLRIIISFYLFFGFITTIIREIIKDIEDVNGDLKINAKTLPIVIGRKRANRIAFSFSILLLISQIIIIKSFLIEYSLFLSYSIIFILLPLLYFMYKLWEAKSKKEYSYLSKLMKLIMFFGILSMLFFKFI